METSKKMAAAMAAVMHYIKTQEELLALQALQAAQGRERPAAIRFWGQSARQSMMQMRNLMQFRSFKGSVFR